MNTFTAFANNSRAACAYSGASERGMDLGGLSLDAASDSSAGSSFGGGTIWNALGQRAAREHVLPRVYRGRARDVTSESRQAHVRTIRAARYVTTHEAGSPPCCDTTVAERRTNRVTRR